MSERKVRAGQPSVSPGTQVISLVQRDIWVQANYKETQVRHIHAGDEAEIKIDAFPGIAFRGKCRSGRAGKRVAPVFRRPTTPLEISRKSFSAFP